VGVQVAMAVAEKEVASKQAAAELPRVLHFAEPAREAVAVPRIVTAPEPAGVAEPAVS
jgi:hypothetical protein